MLDSIDWYYLTVMMLSLGIALCIWGFWTAPYVRFNKKRTAPLWVWLIGGAMVYDYFVARRILKKKRRMRAKLVVHGLAMLVFALALIAYIIYTFK